MSGALVVESLAVSVEFCERVGAFGHWWRPVDCVDFVRAFHVAAFPHVARLPVPASHDTLGVALSARYRPALPCQLCSRNGYVCRHVLHGSVFRTR